MWRLVEVMFIRPFFYLRKILNEFRLNLALKSAPQIVRQMYLYVVKSNFMNFLENSHWNKNVHIS